MARDRNLRPRSPGHYDNTKHGRRENGGPPDDRTINPGAGKVNLMRPRWSEGPLVVRPYPPLNFEDPTQFVPGRRTIDSHGQALWAVRAPVAKYVGINEHYSWILDYPWDKEINPEVVKN